VVATQGQGRSVKFATSGSLGDRSTVWQLLCLKEDETEARRGTKEAGRCRVQGRHCLRLTNSMMHESEFHVS
jgi:hypothetical protein